MMNASYDEVASAYDIPRERQTGSKETCSTPSYNVAPGFSTPVLFVHEGEVALRPMTWGLIPSFTAKGTENFKQLHWRMFNARSETARESPVFRRCLSRRCLVPVRGFYEWKKEGNQKQPYFIYERKPSSISSESFTLLAGIYDMWINSAGDEVWTYAILTTDPIPSLAWLHDRMPVFADLSWIGSSASDTRPLGSHKAEDLDLCWHPVTPRVGKTSFKEASCCEDVRERKGSIQALFSAGQAAAGVKRESEGGAGAPLVGLKLGKTFVRRIEKKKKTASPQTVGKKQRSITAFFHGAQESSP